jgi:predicted secreted protein
MSSQLPPIQLPNSGLQRFHSTVGQKHVIQIVSNPSTGYRWEMTYQEQVKNCLDVVSKNTVYDDKEIFFNGVRKVGSPSKQEWEFQTNCAGLYRITFEYRRHWEQGSSIFKTVSEFITN